MAPVTGTTTIAWCARGVWPRLIALWPTTCALQDDLSLFIVLRDDRPHAKSGMAVAPSTII